MILEFLIAASNSAGPYLYQSRVNPTDPAADKFFGTHVTISRDGATCAVGIPGESAGNGAVYIFTKSGVSWVQQQKILPPGGEDASGTFGSSTALSADGNTCAISANGDNNSGGTDAGSFFIYTRTAGVWTQQTRQQASDAAAGDLFGRWVELSDDGNTLVTGSQQDDNAGGTNAGAAYVFTRSGASWSQQQKLIMTDATASDSVGACVAISADGNTCVIGATSEDNAGGTDAGSAYVWTRTAGVWTQQAKLIASDGATNNLFGISVSLSADGSTCAVGASAVDIPGWADAGATYIFTRSGTSWSEQAKLLATDARNGDQFGESVDLSSDGNLCVIGSPKDNNSGGTDAGSAYVFQRNGTTWTQLQFLQDKNGTANDRFGTAVTVSGDGRTAMVGAWQAELGALANAGGVYVFLW